ncbi:hypothetical protein GGS23DRAFT_592128 [Durotheca rogersii]|uniref:uncharacterized protein n=1 Tax=Durotheca rogersii TaxID=419775 RepID=UPI00221EF663|nr:uncharacterized protein GGS23DRAFT_592128 [Durotheca rogersii]KAI5868349.1 hypothetical protein GGS23DRAFT_592128 [Durotheca rogersii]
MPPTNRLLTGQGGDIWEQYKSIIQKLYETDRKTLKEVKKIMEIDYKFPVMPLSTYETRLREGLGLRKKLKSSDWAVVYHRYERRRDAGRETGVYLNGTRIPWKKVWKEIRRTKARTSSGGQNHTLPAGVDVRTPSPEPHSMLSPSVMRQRPSLLAPSTGSIPPQISTDTGLSFRNYQCSPTVTCFLGETRVIEALKPALEKYSFSLSDIPWNIFSDIVFSIANNGGPHTRLNPPMTRELRFPSAPLSFSDLPPSSKVPAPNFDPYYFLAKAAYLLSNNLVNFSSRDNCLGVFRIILDKISLTVLSQLFQSDTPTVRAAWEFSVRCAGHCGYRDAFVLLVNIGLRRLKWLRPMGHLCLSFAAAMGALDTVRNLIGAGVRADDLLETAESENVAVLQAAATGNLDCVKMLMETCDVNQVVKCRGVHGVGASTLSVFLSTLVVGKFVTSEKRDHEYQRQFVQKTQHGTLMVGLSLEDMRQSEILSLILDSGADVDATWKGDMDSTMRQLYQTENIPESWRSTVLEQSYYWDVDLFHRLLPYSSRKTARITRPGICLAVKQGQESYQQYLKSSQGDGSIDTGAFVELGFAEQFLMETKRIDVDVVWGLLESGIDPNLPSLPTLDIHFLLRRLVDDARRHGRNGEFDATLTCMLRWGAEITPEVLEAGVEHDGTDLLRVLADHGADVRKYGSAALSTAARLNNYAAVMFLLGFGVDINDVVYMNSQPWSVIALASNTQGFSPSASQHHEKALRRHNPGTANFEMLQYLIYRGAVLKNSPSDPNAFDFLHRLLVTTSRDDLLLEKMKLFLNSIQNPRDLSNPRACLLEACLSPKDGPSDTEIKQRLEILELLIEHGTPMATSHALSPLIYWGGKQDLILKFLDAGVDINAYSRATRFHSFPCTPVQAAANRGEKDLVALLVDRGANINQPAHKNRGKTALQAACGWNASSAAEKEKKLTLVRCLIENGADVNAAAAASYGCTALQHAAALGDIETALLLIHHGANPNAGPYKHGERCALDAAALSGRLDVVQLLLNVGGLSYNEGESGYDGAIQSAEKLGHYAVADTIRAHARRNVEVFGGNLAKTFGDPRALDHGADGTDESSDSDDSDDSDSSSW